MNIFLSKKTLSFLFFWPTFTILAEIIEIKHFHEILDYVAPQSIVLVDIDNTVLEPHADHNHIGSDQWFTHLLQTHPNFEQVLNFYCSTVLTTHMQAVEPTISNTLKVIEKSSLLFGFTMRSIVLAPSTIEQLAHNNIVFPTQIPDKGFMISGAHPVMVYHDVIFCQGKKDGETLFAVLKNYGITPACIVMIDDKRKYLETMETECEKRGVKFFGLRYGYLDEKVAQFLQAHS